MQGLIRTWSDESQIINCPYRSYSKGNTYRALSHDTWHKVVKFRSGSMLHQPASFMGTRYPVDQSWPQCKYDSYVHITHMLNFT